MLVAVVLLLGTFPVSAAAIEWDGGGGDGSWHTAANWSGDRVPGSADDVTINAPAGVTVVFSSGLATVRSLQGRSSLQLTGGRLSLAGGQSRITGPFSLAGFGTLRIQGAGTELSVEGGTSLVGGTLECVQGAVVRLPGLRELNVLDRGLTLTAQDPGSVLDASAVTNVLHGRSYTLTLEAVSGGQLDCPGLARLDGNAEVVARGTGSRVDLSGIRGVWSNTNATRTSSLEVQDDAEVRMPGLTGLERVNLTIRQADRGVPTAGLTSFRSAQLEVQHTTNNFPALTEFVDGEVVARAGSRLMLTNVGELTVTAGAPLIQVSGPNSQVEFSGATGLVVAPGALLELEASVGGMLDLSGVVTRDGRISVRAEGAGTLIDLSAVRGVWGNQSGTQLSQLEVLAGGEVRAPELTGLYRTELAIRDGASRFPTAGLRSLVQGELIVERTTNDFSALVDIRESDLTVTKGGVLRLPGLTTLSLANASQAFRADGIGSVLDLSRVTRVLMEGNSARLELTAVAGARIDLSRATNPNGRVQVTARGPGSTVDLSGVQGTWRNEAPTWDSALAVEDAGTILIPGVTALERIDVRITDTGVLSVDAIRALLRCKVYLDATTVSFASLTDRETSTFIYWNGGRAVFPAAGDLVVTDIRAPGAAAAGELVTLGWTVRNQSTNAVTGARSDAVSLSRNQTVGSDLFLGHLAVDNTLAPGESRRYTNTVIIPSGLTGGYYFMVTADSLFECYEDAAEENNSLVASTVTALSAADLQVTSLTAPAGAQFGAGISVTWVVKNGGSMPAARSWNDRLYLTANATNLTGARTLLTRPAVSTLAAGASYTNTQTVTLPLESDRTPGTRYLAVSADYSRAQPEADELNNSRSQAIALDPPPLPDLAVATVLAPAQAAAGQPVSLLWCVTNRGSASATGLWSETLSASNTLAGVIELARFDLTNTLAAGESQWRTQAVTLPAAGLAGEFRFGAHADRFGDVLESDENNNATQAATPTLIPLQLSLVVAATSVVENAGLPLRAVITRNGPAADPLTLVLASSDPGEVVAPPALTLGAGQTAGVVDFIVRHDGRADGPKTVTLTATATGYPAAEAVVTVLDSDLPRLSLSLVTNQVGEGRTVGATVTREHPDPAPLTVTFASDAPGQFSPPLAVILPAGSSAWDFALLAVDDTLVEPPAVHAVTASAPGYESATASVTILDNDGPTVTLTLADAAVGEGAGNQATRGTLTREPVSARSVAVEVVSSDPTAAFGPARVVIPANQASASFPVAAVDDALLDGPQTAVFTPHLLASGTDLRVGQGVGATLTVQDDDGPSLRVEPQQALVAEGLNPATTVLVSRNTPPTNSLTVALASSDVREAVVPASVILPAGSSAVRVNLTTPADGVPDGNRTVTLTATASGYTSGSGTVVVTDTDLPDLAVREVSAPASGWAGLPALFSYRIVNQGLTSTATNFLTRVLLSRDPVIGDDVLLHQQRFTGTLAVGQELAQSLQLNLPVAVGPYWLVVITDVDHELAEGLEDNNSRMAAQPIEARPEYTATAWTDADLVPPGTKVVIEGEVQFAVSPRAHVPVAVHLVSRGTERILRATTSDNGRFYVVFEPLPTETGFYELFAAAPGVTTGAVQDAFRLLGMKALPAVSSFKLAEGSTVARSVTLRNLSDVPLTGLAAVVTNAPAGLQVALELASQTLPGAGTGTLVCRFTPASPDASGPVDVRLTTAEGVTNTVRFEVRVEPLTPRLSANPSRLATGMARGRQTPVEVELANEGGAATGPLTMVLPEAPWLHLASTNPLPSLAPGETRRVTLLLAPAADLALGPYKGAFAVNSTHASLTVPFEFRAVSEAQGDLLVTAEDEFTYYAEGAPRLAGAKVVVRDAYAYSNARTGVTDTNGQLLLGALTEGPYEVEVSADNHVNYRGTLMVAAGQTNELTAFLSRTTVKYTWTVEPVQIEDRYRITIETTFETAVPVPVVTMEPNLIDVAEYAGADGQVEFRISNHGLIAAQNLALRVPVASAVQFPTLTVSDVKDGDAIIELGNLAAQSSLVLPARVQGSPGAVGAALQSGREPRPASDSVCSYEVEATWELSCGYVQLEYDTTTTVYTGAAGCGSAFPLWTPGPGGGGKPPRRRPPSGFGGGIGWVASSPPPWQASSTCDPDCLVRAGLGCIPGPLGDAIGIQQCISGLFSDEFNPLKHLDCTVQGLGMLPGGSTPACAYDVLRCFMEFTPLSTAAQTRTTVQTSGTTRPASAVSLHGSGATAVASSDTLAPYRAAMRAYMDMIRELTFYPYSEWLKHESLPGNPDSALWWFSQMLRPDSDEGRTISAAEWINYGANPEVVGVEPMVIDTFRFRWGYSLDAWSRGIYAPNDTNGNIIDFEKLRQHAQAYKAGHEWALQNGYPNPLIAIIETVRTLAAQGENGGICARVKFRTEQEAVISRDAFRASLELENQDPVRLEDVEVSLQVLDEAGQDVTDRFGIRPPELTGLSGVDGTGILPAGVTGSARWILIPTSDAAPTAEVQYYVTGRFRYSLAGTEVSVPLALAPISVLPSPRLVLHYFHERDVFSDDPFTSELEPRIPFNLAVMVQNLGQGLARDFRIRSGQPQIVENLKGLLIDYQILATEVAGQPLSPTLTASFGDIGPGQTAIGRWLFGSSLQGLFTDYQASFEHLDALGEQKLSLIDGLTIHEMIHLVQAPGAFEDGRPDFLVNDVPDLYDRPDTLHLSDGRTNTVAVVEQAVPSATPSRTNLVITLQAPMPSQWAYLRVPDPGAGQYRLVSVTRPDGTEVAMGTNVWVTDRTFLGVGRRPTYETVLHLLDYDSPGLYTLTYSEVTNDQTPPSSQVLPLAANSGERIAVAWSGEDNARGSGVAAYDLYVSEDDGPFLLWLAQTPGNGAIYTGRQGHAYAFYSVAADRAGNVEAIPGAADARTSVTLVNRPPSLGLLADQAVDEGDEFRFTLPVTDPDLPADRLTFSLLTAPAGLVLEPLTGQLRWPTSEANGPGTNQLTFSVTDNGTPPLSVTGGLQLIVRELNAPPVMTAETNRIINEGWRLTFALATRDFDLPANQLRYALGPGRPAGATLDAVSGVFDWQPTETQGPSTNRIQITVSDDGVPPLAATNEFLVVVRDTLSELAVTLGSTNLFAGETGVVPVLVTSGLDLETVRLDVEADPARLVDLAVQSQTAEVAYLLLEPASPGRYVIELGFNTALLESGTRPVAWIEFRAVSGVGSASVPLPLRAVTGHRSGGVPVGHASGEAGRVIVVERDPVLEVGRSSSGTWQLLVYGHPGSSYVLEATPSLETPQWVPGPSHTPSARVQAIDLPVSETQPAQFYRVREQR